MFLIWIQFCIYTHFNDDFNIYLEDGELNLEFAQGLLVKLSNTHPIILLIDERICSCGLDKNWDEDHSEMKTTVMTMIVTLSPNISR